MRAALREMGYVPKNSSVNQLVMWEEAERKFMEDLLHRYGYEREDKDAHYQHMTVEQYKASQEASILGNIKISIARLKTGVQY
jgi:hypothetical protein